MSISTAHYSNIAGKASVSHHFLCVQCARLAIMAMAGRNRTPQILRLATGLSLFSQVILSVVVLTLSRLCCKVVISCVFKTDSLPLRPL